MKKTVIFLVFCMFLSQSLYAMALDPLSGTGAKDDKKDQGQGLGVRIAIIDSGISTLAVNPEQIAKGKNYIKPTEGTEDKIGHGTAIASLLLGRPSRGLLGASPRATLVPLVYCTLTDEGKIVKGDATMLAQCIRDAVDLFECRVINLSAGVLEDSVALREAVLYAQDQGAVIVSAVGNDHRDNPNRIYYPAAYDQVVGVGALNVKGRVASFSQRNRSVAICAPGDNLWVARISGKMTRVSGTSYACAYVSATASNILSLNPSLTPKEVQKILEVTAHDIEEVGYDTNSGFGALNEGRALQYQGEAALLKP